MARSRDVHSFLHLVITLECGHAMEGDLKEILLMDCEGGEKTKLRAAAAERKYHRQNERAFTFAPFHNFGFHDKCYDMKLRFIQMPLVPIKAHYV